MSSCELADSCTIHGADPGCGSVPATVRARSSDLGSSGPVTNWRRSRPRRSMSTMTQPPSSADQRPGAPLHHRGLADRDVLEQQARDARREIQPPGELPDQVHVGVIRPPGRRLPAASPSGNSCATGDGHDQLVGVPAQPGHAHGQSGIHRRRPR